MDRVHHWLEIVQKIRSQHNGVMSVKLHFGHDGDNTCSFADYERTLVSYSSDSMQRSVEQCYSDWKLMNSVNFATKHGDVYEKCPQCGRENWTHEHPSLYGGCPSISDSIK